MTARPPLPDRAKLAATAFDLLANDPAFKVVETEIRGNMYRVFRNAPENLAELLAPPASRYGDRQFMDFRGECCTFREFWTKSCRFAGALRDITGIKHGERVALAMRNYPEWCIAYVAVIVLGGVVVPLNAWWKEGELEYALEKSGARKIIVDRKRFDTVLPLKEKLGLTLILARDADVQADYTYHALMEATPHPVKPEARILPDDDFCIIFTSGSTGKPKGVVLTHRGCISSLLSWSFMLTVLERADDGPGIFGQNPGVLLGLPLFHVTASHIVFLLSYISGRRMSMMYRWNAREAVDMVNAKKLTNFVGVPGQIVELMHAAKERPVPTLAGISAGGAKCPADHVAQIIRAFPDASLSGGYGMSETNALGCFIASEDYRMHPDSTGIPVPPLTDLKITDENGNEQERGETGEIRIRSAVNFREYLDLPEETADSLTPDGWFCTGDLGYMDAQGRVCIAGRKKELIIRSGENISCLEVENAVYRFPQIAEASVFSVPDNIHGERVGLAVSCLQGCTVDLKALHEFLAGRLARFKVPERIWLFPGPLPHLATGKSDRISIRTNALGKEPDLSV